MSALEWIVIAVFAVWFVATVGYQFLFDAMYPWVCRFDWFHLLPALNYFSVVPRLFRLSYRDRMRDGSVTEWRRFSLEQRWSWWRVTSISCRITWVVRNRRSCMLMFCLTV